MPATVHRRSAVRLSVVLGVCVALVLGLGAFLWQLRALAGHLAEGDLTTGIYVQDPRLADEAADAVLNGLGHETPAAPAPEPTLPAPTAPTAPAPTDRDQRGAETAPAAEPTVGALFSPGDDGDPEHHCSASVVHSPGADLVVTAAHCVHTGGFRTNLVFAPGYRDGVLPYGVWVPTRIHVDRRWSEDHDPDHDIAFLEVRRPGHPGARLEDLTGGERIAFRSPLPAPARLLGYPNDAEAPLSCRNTARTAGPTQVRFDCTGFPDGTSGGPLLTGADGPAGTGTLIGVIGGRDGGGDDATSYSSRFDDAAEALYERAAGD
ncbi:trypsin-like serine peptidase [Streptomyces sp. NPDC090022]|uniref:trypsin-like serine peptidase n=1 Tax=Streptomyces sp. NPDC090022 TaxID=3365920 RepID=UPI003807195A